MKVLFGIMPFVIVAFLGCSFLRNQHCFFWQFSDRIAAEKASLNWLSEQYDNLPSKGYYYVMVRYNLKYHIHRNAIWYDKQKEELAVEVDIGSGKACWWTGIDKSALNQLVAANKGFIFADSVGKYEDEFCYSSCYAGSD